MSKSPMWLPPSHDFELYLWVSEDGTWCWACPEKCVCGGGAGNRDAAIESARIVCNPQKHEGLVFIDLSRGPTA